MPATKLLIPLFFVLSITAYGQEVTGGPATRGNLCGQKRAALDPIIEQAERDQYAIRRVEILGNFYIRDRDIRKSMDSEFSEGGLFTRKKLEDSMKGIAKLKKITLENIGLRTDQKTKDVDILFCVKERAK
jgi:outer membrane protein assembly factor BamA